jgi:hypothetical protein
MPQDGRFATRAAACGSAMTPGYNNYGADVHQTPWARVAQFCENPPKTRAVPMQAPLSWQRQLTAYGMRSQPSFAGRLGFRSELLELQTLALAGPTQRAALFWSPASRSGAASIAKAPRASASTCHTGNPIAAIFSLTVTSMGQMRVQALPKRCAATSCKNVWRVGQRGSNWALLMGGPVNATASSQSWQRSSARRSV